MAMHSKSKVIIYKDMPSYTIRRKFKSRKNEVYLVDLKKADETVIPAVLKKYIGSRENKDKEALLLKLLAKEGLTVSKIYFEGSDHIILEYIYGKTLLDRIIDLEFNQDNHINNEESYLIFFKLIKWLNDFYRITEKVFGKGYIFGDINFRNFIIQDEIYGIDLEDSNCRGYREEDGGRLCAYLLTYSPPFTKWKLLAARQAVKIMTHEFGYNKKLLKEEMNKELYEIQKRRNITYTWNSSFDIF